eukprot:scaffold318_cov75-Phaeocystis_antarctica.AAC.1
MFVFAATLVPRRQDTLVLSPWDTHVLSPWDTHVLWRQFTRHHWSQDLSFPVRDKTTLVPRFKFSQGDKITLVPRRTGKLKSTESPCGSPPLVRTDAT